LVFFEITLLGKFALIETSTGWLIAVLAVAVQPGVVYSSARDER